MKKKKQRQQEKFTSLLTSLQTHHTASTLVLNQSPSSIHPSIPSSFFFVKSSLIDADCSHQSAAQSTTPPHTQLTADCIIAPPAEFSSPSFPSCCVLRVRAACGGVVVWFVVGGGHFLAACCAARQPCDLYTHPHSPLTSVNSSPYLSIIVVSLFHTKSNETIRQSSKYRYIVMVHVSV